MTRVSKQKIKELLMIANNHSMIQGVTEISPCEIIVSQHVRALCKQNLCGQYCSNFMCPPFVDSVADFKAELKTYSHGILLLSHMSIDINNQQLVDQDSLALHMAVLQLEKQFSSLDIVNYRGLIAGHCKLCGPPCPASYESSGTCKYPHQARPSLEAVGIDVVTTCNKVDIPIKFTNTSVTWVGLLLL